MSGSRVGRSEADRAPVPEQIDEVIERVAATLRLVRYADYSRFNHASVAFALMLMAAHELVHDGAREEDALEIAREAWSKARGVHARDCEGR